MTTTETTQQHRSVSQLKQYEKCPLGYRLERLDRVWQRPAAWLPQGSAVHEAGEAWELSERRMSLEEVQDVFRESYAKHVAQYAEETPNFDYWFRSGPYAGEADIERRYRLGLEQVEKMLAWYAKHPYEVPWKTPDGKLAVELGFDMDLDGVRVRGFIDLVILDERTGGLIVRDNKTGRLPGDDFQLGTYKVAMELEHGVTINNGDYWMGRTGKPTLFYDLTDWSVPAVAAKFRELEDNITRGEFDPDPEPSKCMFCNVSTSCAFAVA